MLILIVFKVWKLVQDNCKLNYIFDNGEQCSALCQSTIIRVIHKNWPRNAETHKILNAKIYQNLIKIVRWFNILMELERGQDSPEWRNRLALLALCNGLMVLNSLEWFYFDHK